MSEKRKRRNLSVPPDLDGELSRLAEKGGFSGVCELILTVLRLFVLRALEEEGRAMSNACGVSREVQDMFAEFEDYEPTPTNTNVPKRHRRTDI